jgi:folate-binding protein YgfZ
MIVAVDWTSVLALTGRDRVKFLHNLCTNDIFKLATGREGQSFGKRPKDDFTITPDGRACMAAALNRQGKMIAVFIVWMLKESLLLEVDRGAAPALLEHLRASIIMDKVEVADRSADWKSGYSIEPMPERLQFSSPPVRTGHRLLRAAPQDLAPANGDFFSAACVQAGWPRWGVEMDSTMLPMEAGLDPMALSYTKGCYLGQEVIQRVKTYSEPPRELKQLHTDAPATPGPVMAGGEKVGEIRSAHGTLALALLKKSHAREGTRVDGAVVRDLPWHLWK